MQVILVLALIGICHHFFTSPHCYEEQCIRLTIMVNPLLQIFPLCSALINAYHHISYALRTSHILVLLHNAASLFNNVCMSLFGLHLDMKDWSPRNSIVTGQRWGGGMGRGRRGGIERDERGGMDGPLCGCGYPDYAEIVPQFISRGD